MELSGNRDRCFHKISVCTYYQHIRSIGCAATFTYELEVFTNVIKALKICAAPSSLFQNNDKRVVILKNRMINLPLFHTS